MAAHLRRRAAAWAHGQLIAHLLKADKDVKPPVKICLVHLSNRNGRKGGAHHDRTTPPTEREGRGTTPRRSLLGQAGREAGGLRSARRGRQRQRAGKTRGWGTAGLRPTLAEDLPGAPERSGCDARRSREGLEGALPRVPAAEQPVLYVDGGRRARGG